MLTRRSPQPNSHSQRPKNGRKARLTLAVTSQCRTTLIIISKGESRSPAASPAWYGRNALRSISNDSSGCACCRTQYCMECYRIVFVYLNLWKSRHKWPNRLDTCALLIADGVCSRTQQVRPRRPHAAIPWLGHIPVRVVLLTSDSPLGPRVLHWQRVSLA